MSGLRHQRITKQIHKDLSDIFIRINKTNFQGKMISISEVRLTPDLSIAKSYISVFPSADGQAVIDEIETMTSQIRLELGNKIRHQVRKVPELRFYLDVSFDEMEKIDKLLKGDNDNQE